MNAKIEEIRDGFDYQDDPNQAYVDVDELLAEIDRLTALLKVDWIKIEEAELQPVKIYWILVKGKSYIARYLGGGNFRLLDFDLEWYERQPTHVAEFHYAEPPAVE